MNIASTVLVTTALLRVYVAKYFGLEASLVRIAAILCIFAAGATLWIYLILWAVLPYEPEA